MKGLSQGDSQDGVQFSDLNGNLISGSAAVQTNDQRYLNDQSDQKFKQ